MASTDELLSRLRGTLQTIFRIGTVQWKDSSGAVEARNTGDTGYVVARGADPVGNNDFVTKQYLAASASKAPLLWGNESVQSSTTTRWMSPGYDRNIAKTTTIEFEIPFAGTLHNLRIRHNTTAGNGNAIVYTLFVNGSSTALTVSLASTISSGTDVTNNVSVSAGDRISLQVTKASSIAGSPTDILASCEITAT